VRQSTLDALLADEGVSTIDVLVIDTEGFEAEVLAGFDLRRWKPKVLIIELADFHPDLPSHRAQDAKLRAEILAAGYEIVFKDSINTIFSAL